MKTLIYVVTVVLGFFVMPAVAGGYELQGKVIHVNDGDTLVMLVEGNEKVTVRLSSIDAPESSHTNKEKGKVGQPFSDASKQLLASLVKGAVVQARCFERDRFGRSVCEVFKDGQSANRAMVAAGMAWANTAANHRYLRDRSLIGLQSEAQREKKGLWSSKGAIEPWVWRELCWREAMC